MRILILAAIVLVTILGCGKKGSNNKTPAIPGKAVLTFPLQNQVCTQGTSVSATQSIVIFRWLKPDNAGSYELTLKNLLNGEITKQTALAEQVGVTLNKNTPYAWSIISKASESTETAESDTWKFYNAGEGIVNYAPYPAEITAPGPRQTVNAVNGSITLAWNGSDADNDILNYDVYFSDVATPVLYKANITSSPLINVAVQAGKRYYCKIITRDKQGNTTNSDTWYFDVR